MASGRHRVIPVLASWSSTVVSSRGSRRADLAGFNQLDVTIDLRLALSQPRTRPEVGTGMGGHPTEFLTCLRARDARVRIVRANLLPAGVILSGNINADMFDYGIFSCV
jgi:hypothetical protein